MKKFVLLSIIVVSSFFLMPFLNAETFSDNSRVHVLVFDNNTNQQLESFNYLNSANFMYSNTPLRVYNQFQNYVPYPQYYYDIVYTIYFDRSTANNFLSPLGFINGCNIYIEGGSTSSGCTYTTNYSNDSITISASSVHSSTNQTSFTFQMNFNGVPSPYYLWYHAIRYELSIIANEDTSLSNDTYNQGVYNIINNQNANSQELNNNITSDESLSDNEINDYIDDFNDYLPSNQPITNLILLPITFLQSIVNNIGSSCVPYSFGTLYNTEIKLPCIDLSQRLGSTLWTNIDVLTSMFMIYNLGMLFITIFTDITSLNDSFLQLYEPRHAYSGYRPRHAEGGDS